MLSIKQNLNNIFVADIMKFGFKERGNRQHGDQQPGAPSHVSDVSQPRHVCHKSRDLTARRPRVLSHRSNSLLLLLIFLFCLPASYSTDPNKLKVKITKYIHSNECPYVQWPHLGGYFGLMCNDCCLGGCFCPKCNYHCLVNLNKLTKYIHMLSSSLHGLVPSHWN